MMDPRPAVVVPKSAKVSEMIEIEPLRTTPRAQRNGIAVIAPRNTQPADLMLACHCWPKALHGAGVSRVAVVLGVEAYVIAEPMLRACARRMKEQGIAIAYFHEGHLDTDQIRAWFERRKPCRRVTTDLLVKLSERYVERGDVRSATHAMKLAEAVAA